jgi:hypothetical protein
MHETSSVVDAESENVNRYEDRRLFLSFFHLPTFLSSHFSLALGTQAIEL